MTNDQLTTAFMGLASFIVGYVIAQSKARRIVDKRLDAQAQAIKLIVDSVEKNNTKHALVIDTVKDQLIAIMDSLQQFRKPKKDERPAP